MKLDRGDLVVIPFPFTDLASEKQRPALVLTSASYNAASPDLVAAYVTSQPQHDRWAVPVRAPDLTGAVLVRESWVRADKLATIEQGLVRKVVGRLVPKTVDVVRAKVRELLVERP